MAENINSTAGAQFSGLLGSMGGGSQTKKAEMGKDEFLTLLVTQLKNQDPEAPVDSKEFAVQLAQFTQVEKLISIDQKLSNQANATSSMAGYLGQQVVLNNGSVQVKSGDGGKLQLELGQDASAVTVQLLNKAGAVIGEKSVGELSSGKHMISLNQLQAPDGVYTAKVKAIGRGGGEFEPRAAVGGVVTGFIPGLDPKLIVGGREVSMSEVKEVSVPSAAV
jgi:flagellar basal-body rod modification protein FlgD